MSDEQGTVTLARDEYTTKRRALSNHPEAVSGSSRVDVEDAYGNVTTWLLDLYRLDGEVTAFVQRGSRDEYVRLVMPPQVTAAIANHQDGLVHKARRQRARRIVADKRARGETLGNAEALRRARAKRTKR